MKFAHCLSLMSMFLMVLMTQDPAKPVAASAELPSARKVIEKYIQARGGYETLESRTNVHFRANGTSTNGSPFVYEVYQAEGMFHAQFTYDDGRVVERGANTLGRFTANGERDGIVWERTQGGVIREIKGDERQEYLRRRSSVSSSTRWLETFQSIECVSIERINDRDAYKLHFLEHNGGELYRYFDVETGLCLRRVAVEEFNNRQQTVVRDYSNYQRIGEFLVSKKHIATYGSSRYVYEMDLYEVDVKIPKGMFDVPRSIAPKVVKAATDRPDKNK